MGENYPDNTEPTITAPWDVESSSVDEEIYSLDSQMPEDLPPEDDDLGIDELFNAELQSVTATSADAFDTHFIHAFVDRHTDGDTPGNRLRSMAPSSIYRAAIDSYTRFADQYNSANKDSIGRISRTKELPAPIIATLAYLHFDMAMISYSGHRDPNQLHLGVYDKATRLYVTSASAMANSLRSFSSNLSVRTVNEAVDLLFAWADPQQRTAYRAFDRYPIEIPVREHTTWDRYIPTATGVFDIETRELIDYDRDDHVFTSRIEYTVPHSEPVVAPLERSNGEPWHPRQLIEEFFPDDEQRRVALRQVMHAMLCNGKRWEQMVFFYGKGSDGKSTVADLIRTIIGTDSIVNADIQLLSGDSESFGVQRINDNFFTNLVIGLDNSTNGGQYIENSGRIKEMVTHESFGKNRKNKDYVDERFRGLVLQNFNALPRLRDTSPGMSRRTFVLHFDRQFLDADSEHYIEGATVKDKRIANDFLKRRDVIEWFLWYLLVDMESPDHLLQPESSLVIKKQMFNASNPVHDFLLAAGPLANRKFYSAELLYGFYRLYRARFAPNTKELGLKAFTEDMCEALDKDTAGEYNFTVERAKSTTSRLRIGDKGVDNQWTEPHLYNWALPNNVFHMYEPDSDGHSVDRRLTIALGRRVNNVAVLRIVRREDLTHLQNPTSAANLSAIQDDETADARRLWDALCTMLKMHDVTTNSRGINIPREVVSRLRLEADGIFIHREIRKVYDEYSSTDLSERIDRNALNERWHALVMRAHNLGYISFQHVKYLRPWYTHDKPFDTSTEGYTECDLLLSFFEECVSEHAAQQVKQDVAQVQNATDTQKTVPLFGGLTPADIEAASTVTVSQSAEPTTVDIGDTPADVGRMTHEEAQAEIERLRAQEARIRDQETQVGAETQNNSASVGLTFDPSTFKPDNFATPTADMKPFDPSWFTPDAEQASEETPAVADSTPAESVSDSATDSTPAATASQPVETPKASETPDTPAPVGLTVDDLKNMS